MNMYAGAQQRPLMVDMPVIVRHQDRVGPAAPVTRLKAVSLPAGHLAQLQKCPRGDHHPCR